MYKNQNGFSAIIILISIVGIALITFSGWKVWQINYKPSPQVSSNTNSTKPHSNSLKPEIEQYQPVIPPGWLTYKDDKYGFSFAYPTEWGKTIDDAYPGGGYDASKDWLVHKVTADVRGKSAKGVFGQLNLDVNTKNYQEFRSGKAMTPYEYTIKDGKGYWTASATVDVEGDNYEPGDIYPVPVEKTINGTNIYKFYSNYEGIINAGWRFPVKDGIVTITLPQLGESDMFTGETTGDTDSYKKIATDILNSIDIL